MGLNLKDPPKLISKGSNPIVESNSSVKSQSIEFHTNAHMDFTETDERSPSIVGSLYSVDSKKSAIESTSLAPVEVKSVKFDPMEKVQTFNCMMFSDLH
jgi:hypothetical protein